MRSRTLLAFLALFFAGVIFDQAVKGFILCGFRWESSFVSIVLAYNPGVAFSMFAFLEGWLKYLQILLLFGIALFLVWNRELFVRHYFPFALLLAAGSSNVLDRFVHGGVVDYIFWHYGFEFAVFNLADVMINVAVVILLWQSFSKVSQHKIGAN